MSAHFVANVSDRSVANDSRWARLVEKVQAGEPSGLEELYEVFSTGVRFHLCRHVQPQDLDDLIHDLFLVITQSIQKGELREPERLMGYVWTIIRRQLANYIESMVRARRHHRLDPGLMLRGHSPTPEGMMIERQSTTLAFRVLECLHGQHREILERFYIEEQRPAEICAAMALTATQFRVNKSRAKARYDQLLQARLSQRKGFRPDSAVSH